MKNSENLDKLFKDGYQQEYPFDAGLWASMNKDLNTLHKPWWQNKRLVYILIFSLFSIGSIVAITLFSTNKEIAQSKKLTTSSTSETLSQTQNSTITENNTIRTQYEDVTSTNNQPTNGLNPVLSPVKHINEDGSKNVNSAPNKPSEPKSTKPIDRDINVNNGNPPAQEPPESPLDKTVGVTDPAPEQIQTPNEKDETNSPASDWEFWWYMKTRDAFTFNHYEQPKVDKIGIDKIHPIMLHGRFFTLQYEQLWAINGKKKFNLGNEEEQYRSNAEQFGNSFEQNLVLSLRKGNWSVASGLGVKSMQENVAYSADFITETVTERSGELTLISEEYIKDGKRVILLGHKKEYDYSYDTASKVFYQGNNQLSFIKVPLRLGYSKSFGRVDLSVWGMYEFMKLRNFDGQYVNTAMNALLPDGDLPKSSPLNMEGGFGVKAGYFIKSNYGIGLSFQQKYMLNSTHKDLNQRYNTTYLGWYLNYNF